MEAHDFISALLGCPSVDVDYFIRLIEAHDLNTDILVIDVREYH